MSRLLIGLFAASLLSGCATVAHGRRQTIGVSSTPPGATVTVDNHIKITTPDAVDLKRNSDHTFLFEKEGYQSDSFAITSGTSGWVWGNILLGGVVGGVVDFASGSARKLSEDSVHVTLVPLPKEEESLLTDSGMPTSIEERLKKINDLRDQGYLSPEEYQKKREKIMDEL